MSVKQKLTNKQTSAIGIERVDNGEINHEVDKKHKKHKKERK
ncbi:hypothetical protein [Clostridium lundense]|nr:hypothetical protein [Clostridium lundense]